MDFYSDRPVLIIDSIRKTANTDSIHEAKELSYP